MKTIQNKIIEYIVASPKLLGLALISFFSGHLWYFLISTYYRKSKKGNNLLNSKIGKTSVGVFYNTLIFYPIHLIVNKHFQVEWEQISDLILTTMICSMILQILIFAICIKFLTSK